MLPRLLLTAVVVSLAGPAAAGGLDSRGPGDGRTGPLGLPPLVPPAILLAAGGDGNAGERGGDEAGANAPEAPQAAEGGRGEAGDAAEGGEDDFDLFGDTARREAELADPGLEKDIGRRRAMLRTHQLLGLTTLGLMTATAIVGQVNYANTYGDGADGSDGLRVPHMVLSYTTVAAFATTAGFSLLAPEPVERESSGIDTVTLHKLAVIGAAAGMLAQAGLGFTAARSADAGHPTRPGDLAAIHQVIGWTTLGFMTAAAAVWLF